MVNERIVVTHTRTATTSRFAQVEKAVENLYYLLLFSDPAYAGREDRWSRWAQMGFGISVKEPPRPAALEDRLLLDTDPAAAPSIPMTVRAGNAQAVADLIRLLDVIEGDRRAGTDQPDAARADAVLASDRLRALQERVDTAVRSTAPGEVERYRGALRECVELLTEANVASISVGTLAPA